MQINSFFLNKDSTLKHAGLASYTNENDGNEHAGLAASSMNWGLFRPSNWLFLRFLAPAQFQVG